LFSLLPFTVLFYSLYTLLFQAGSRRVYAVSACCCGMELTFALGIGGDHYVTLHFVLTRREHRGRTGGRRLGIQHFVI
jgi:hypothetical protein